MALPLGTKRTIVVRIVSRGKDETYYPWSTEVRHTFITEPYRHPGNGVFRKNGRPITVVPGDLNIGDWVAITFELGPGYSYFVKAKERETKTSWSETVEILPPTEHEDLFTSGYEGYEE
jgi:hypothetical protein